MESLIANFVGRPRNATFEGREFIVAPVSMIVEGVLNGSLGPLLYPQEEIARNPEAWNGVPLVIYHPTVNGRAVSARSPQVLERSGVGYVFDAKAENNRLVGEAWFDVEKTRKVDRRVLDAIQSGRPMELSTGLITSNEPAEPGAAFNGKAYDYVARNYRPDHLAILPDQKGACSLNDGCGLNVNGDNPMKELIDFLIDNCDCWEEGDREYLGTLNEDKLNSFKKEIVAKQEAELISNKALEGYKSEEGVEVTFNSEGWKVIVPEAEGTPTVATTNQDPPNKEEPKMPEPLTEEQILNAMPESMKADLAFAQSERQRQTDELIGKITANLEGDEKQRVVNTLQDKSLDELHALSLLVPEKKEPEQAGNVQYVMPGQRAHNKTSFNDQEDLLVSPTMNYGNGN